MVKNKETGEKLRFSHLNRADVRQGESLKGGTVIGLSGSTGNSSGPHLDLEYYNSRGQISDFMRSPYSGYLSGGQGGGVGGAGGGIGDVANAFLNLFKKRQSLPQEEIQAMQEFSGQKTYSPSEALRQIGEVDPALIQRENAVEGEIPWYRAVNYTDTPEGRVFNAPTNTSNAPAVQYEPIKTGYIPPELQQYAPDEFRTDTKSFYNSRFQGANTPTGEKELYAYPESANIYDSVLGSLAAMRERDPKGYAITMRNLARVGETVEPFTPYEMALNRARINAGMEPLPKIRQDYELREQLLNQGQQNAR